MTQREAQEGKWAKKAGGWKGYTLWSKFLKKEQSVHTCVYLHIWLYYCVFTCTIKRSGKSLTKLLTVVNSEEFNRRENVRGCTSFFYFIPFHSVRIFYKSKYHFCNLKKNFFPLLKKSQWRWYRKSSQEENQDSGASQKLEEERILRKSRACQMLCTD